MDLEIPAAAPPEPATVPLVVPVTFAEILKSPDIAERFQQVRRYFFLRESTYDLTSRCNVRCDGCYYFEGDKQHAQDNVDVSAWRDLFRGERARGITFVVLAGAEPALVPELLEACFGELPLGAIATNGLVPIPESVGYRIHVSVWGNDATSERVRKSKRMLERQIEIYAGDPRAVFVYTFTRENIAEAQAVVETLAKHGCKVTFNMFSATVGYQGALTHTPASLAETRQTMLRLLGDLPEHLIFSPYSAAAHTDALSLHNLYSCPYPRQNQGQFGLGRTFRQYRSDLSWVREASCCVPDTDCADCRHYAAGSAIVTARMNRHIGSADQFRSWLDYVDTYLAVWIQGYKKSPNLCAVPVPPSLALPSEAKR